MCACMCNVYTCAYLHYTDYRLQWLDWVTGGWGGKCFDPSQKKN